MTQAIVITYERVSTDKQDISRQAQQRERALATFPEAEHRVVQDDGKSAYKVSVFDRPGGAELCALIAAGEVEAIFVDAQDRLSRGKQAEWWNFADLCQQHGTRIFIDGRELRLDDEGDEIKSALDAMLARRESSEKSHRTRSGQEHVARSGRWPWGKVYGYRNVEGHLVLDRAEAAVVRRIFAEYLTGKGQNRIASDLNFDGVRTRNGKLFSPRQIINMLQSRVYLGEVWSKSKAETFCTDAHEPIIDVETFDRAARLRASKRAQPAVGKGLPGAGRPAKRHLLSGLLRCPNGHSMTACTWGATEYYRCQRRHALGDCDCPDISRRKVDEMLVSHFLNRHYDEEAERARLLQAAHAKGQESRDLAIQADREEQEATEALARIKADYRRGAITAEQWADFEAELTEEAQASRNRAEQLRTRAAQLEAEVEHVDTEAQLVAHVAAVLRAAAGDLEAPEAVAKMRAALASTFERITFHPGWTNDVPAGSPLLLGEAQLVPVVRAALLSDNKAACAFT